MCMTFYRLVTDGVENTDLNLNQPGFYTCYCAELEIASLPIAALLQVRMKERILNLSEKFEFLNLGGKNRGRRRNMFGGGVRCGSTTNGH